MVLSFQGAHIPSCNAGLAAGSGAGYCTCTAVLLSSWSLSNNSPTLSRYLVDSSLRSSGSFPMLKSHRPFRFFHTRNLGYPPLQDQNLVEDTSLDHRGNRQAVSNFRHAVQLGDTTYIFDLETMEFPQGLCCEEFLFLATRYQY